MTPREQATGRIQQVRDALSEAEGKWSEVGVRLLSYINVGAREQTMSSLSQIERLGINPWAARADSLAASDAAGWKQWTDDGTDLLENIAGIAQDAAHASLQTIVVDTVKETAGTVKKAAGTVWDFRRWIVVGVVGLAIVVVVTRLVR